jgi:hypothetical protein
MKSEEEPSSGGEPSRLGICTDCGRVYPVQTDADRLRPIGTDGNCRCGNDEFEPLAEREHPGRSAVDQTDGRGSVTSREDTGGSDVADRSK